MESRIRVNEIKKRFENLSTSLPESGNAKNEGNKNIKICDLQRGQVKRTPAFRTAKFHNVKNGQEIKNPENGSQLYSALTDTLKLKLEKPLPKGPAPQKPPRTFAFTKPSPIVQKDKTHTFQRSKTEPHIMLKKIESALLSNQTPYNADKPKPIPRRSFGNDFRNSNVYDTPCISGPAKTTKKEQNCFPIFKNPCANREPVYTEPYTPKFPNGTNRQSSAQRSQTLHYMSTPIMIDNQVSQNGVKQVINLYEDTIKNMLEPFNNNTKSETDSDGDSVKDIKHVVEERKIYAKRVCSIKKYHCSVRGKSNLIDALLLIGIDSDINNGQTAYIKAKFPTETQVPDNFARLVFPDAENWTLIQKPDYIPKSAKHNNYTIFITAADGSRSYAYCRRIQPEGSPFCLPLAYAILTSYRPNSLYYKILNIVESKHGLPKMEFNKFVYSLIQAKFPKKHEPLQIGELKIDRCIDERQASSNISTLLQILTVPIFIQLLSSLLIERKIILAGSYISVLSDCVEGLIKCLYPFEWQHTIISLLPISMSEILEAPTPYIVGLLKNINEPITNEFFSDVEDVIVFDLDNGTVLKKQGDEGSIIPERLGKALKEALYLVPVHSNDIAPSEAIIRLFVELIGHYSNHLISTVPDKSRRFQKENFIKTPSAKSVRLYLEWFTETALFHTFIKERMERTNQIGLFEQRCAEHIVKLVAKEKGKTRGLKNFRDWGISS